MKIYYDDKADLLYLRLDERKHEIINKRITDDIVLDLGDKDKIVGRENRSEKNAFMTFYAFVDGFPGKMVNGRDGSEFLYCRFKKKCRLLGGFMPGKWNSRTGQYKR